MLAFRSDQDHTSTFREDTFDLTTEDMEPKIALKYWLLAAKLPMSQSMQAACETRPQERKSE
jgi:hypothetical protein